MKKLPKSSFETVHFPFVDPLEMAQIKSDKRLLKKLEAGHRHAKRMKGRLVRPKRKKGA